MLAHTHPSLEPPLPGPRGLPLPEDLGWGAWLTGRLAVYEATGEHYTLLGAPHAAFVAQTLGQHLRLLEREAM